VGVLLTLDTFQCRVKYVLNYGTTVYQGKVKVKVKFTLKQAMKRPRFTKDENAEEEQAMAAQRRSRSIALLFL
jgi:hypothetical protein